MEQFGNAALVHCVVSASKEQMHHNRREEKRREGKRREEKRRRTVASRSIDLCSLILREKGRNDSHEPAGARKGAIRLLSSTWAEERSSLF